MRTIATAALLFSAVATAHGHHLEELIHEVTGDDSFDGFGFSVAGAGDVNQDGFDDFVVGAPLGSMDDEEAAGGPTGFVRVYSGADGAKLFELKGTQSNSLFGHSVDGAGDFDGDGYDDIVVGEPDYLVFDGKGGLRAGRVTVWSGKNGSLIQEFIGTEEDGGFGWAVAGIGDWDGDGRPAIAVSAPFEGIEDDVGAPPLAGGPQAGLVRVFDGADGALLVKFGGTAHSEFGSSLARLPDIDGDGHEELIVGAPHHQNAAGEAVGAVYVIGSAQSAMTIVEGEQEHSEFGRAVAGCDDIDGDGSADALAAAPFFVDLAAEEVDAYGKVTVFSAATGAVIGSVTGEQPGFGFSVARIDDMNDDMVCDFAVGQPSETGDGAAFLFSGADLSILATIDGTGLPSFGFSLANAGNVNGTGREELIVGAPSGDGQEESSIGPLGTVRVFRVGLPVPKLCVDSVAPIDWSYTLTQAIPGPETRVVTNCGEDGSCLKFAVADEPHVSWIDIAPFFGDLLKTDPGVPVVISIDPNGLATLTPGFYTTDVIFQNVQDPNDRKVVTVNLTVTAEEPNLSLFAVPEGFDHTYTIGTPTLADDLIQVGNVGPSGSTLDWTATVTYDQAVPEWIVLTPAAGTLEAFDAGTGGPLDDIVVSYKIAGLPEGVYTADIMVTNVGNPLDEEIVPVTLTVVEPKPELCVPDISKIEAQHTIGEPTPLDPIVRTIVNCGHELSFLPWKASTNPNVEWLSLTPMSGYLQGPCPGVGFGGKCNEQPLTIVIDPDGLVDGLYTTDIVIENLADASNVFVIPVQLIVSRPPAILSVTPSAPVVVDYDIGGEVPADVSFQISNIGPFGSILNFAFTETIDVPWLFHTPPGGSLAAGESLTATIQFAVAGLAEAQYTTAVRVQDLENGGQFVEIPVTLNVHLPKPNLCVDGSDSITGVPMAFTYTIPDPFPAPQFRTVSNCGDELSKLGWAIFGDPTCTWLNFTPAAGELDHLESELITFTVDPTGLEEGNYETTVRFQNVFEPFDFQEMLVTLSVDQPDADLCVDDTSTISEEYIIGFDVPGPFVRTIENCGPEGSLLTYSVTTNDPAADWLFFEPLAGSLESGETDPFNIVFVVADVPPGTYSQTLTFRNVADETDFETITVNLTVTDPIPDLCLEPGQGDIQVAYEIGMPKPADQQFNLMNCGHEFSTLNYGITPEPPAAWLTITPLSDVMPPFTSSVPINLSFDPTGLVDGTYSTTLRLQNLDDPLDFEELQVTLVVGNIRFFPGDVLVGGLLDFDSAYEVEFDGLKDMKLTLKIKSGEGEPNGGVQFTVVDPEGGTTESKKVVFSSKKAGKRVFKLQHDGRHKLRIEPYKAKFTNWVLRTNRKLPKLAKKYKATQGPDADLSVRVPVRALPNLTDPFNAEAALMDVTARHKKKKTGNTVQLSISLVELPDGAISPVTSTALNNGGAQVLDVPGVLVGRYVFVVEGFTQPGQKIKVKVLPEQAVVGTTTIILPPL